MAQFFEFTDNGIRFMGFQEVRKSLKDAWETTFGVQLDDSPTSPDGHHIDLEAKTINSVLEAVQVVTTMLNRRQAKGVFLDYLASLLGLTRNEDETDDELRSRMDSASTTGLATEDGIRTYLRDHLGSTVEVKTNSEPEPDLDGIPGHSYRVVIPEAVYEALGTLVEEGKIADADIYVAQLIWNCKPAGIKPDGNMTGNAVDVSGIRHEVKFSMPTDVSIDVSVELTLYTEETFPDYGENAVKEAIEGWATGTNGWAKAEYVPGRDVIPQHFYTPILTVPGIASAVVKIKEASSSTWSTDTIAISSQQMAVLNSVSVEVVQ